MILRFWAACAWLGAGLWVATSAQAQSARLTLSGTVRDVRGDVLPGVTVVLDGTSLGTATDAAGRYALSGLAAGTYRVVFRYVGYRERAETVALRMSHRLDVVLHEEDVAGDEVVVENDAARRAEAAAQATSVLGAKELAAVRGQTLGAALERLPGVTLLQTGPSIAKPVVRGLHSERVVVVNAGVAQEGQQWGGEHGPEIDPFAAGTIEVVRGVAGVEYGVGAIGGVVKIEPHPLREAAGMGGRAAVNLFSNNRQGAMSVRVDASNGRGLSARVQASGRIAGDSRAPSYGLANTGFREGAAQAVVGYHGRRGGLEALVSHFQTRLGIFAGAHVPNAAALRALYAAGTPSVVRDVSYTIEAPRQEVAHSLLSLRSHIETAGGELSAQVGLQRNHRQEYDRHYRFQTIPEGALAFDLTLWTTGGELRFRHAPVNALGGGFVGTVGASGIAQVNTNGEAGRLIPNFGALTGGVFVREAYLRGPLTVEAGLRLDARRLRAYPRVNGDVQTVVTRYASLTGALGATWRLAEAWTVAANVSQGWRPPSVNELYAAGVHHGTAQYEQGDAGLVPEKSLGVDATLRRTAGAVTGEVSAFVNRMNGYVYLRPDTALVETIRGAYPLARYTQDDALLYGFDGGAEWALPRLPLRLGTTVSAVWGENRTRREPLVGLPSPRASVRATALLGTVGPLREAEVAFGTRVVAKQTHVPASLPDFAPPPPGYALLDFDLSASFRTRRGEGTVGLSVENLLDTAYRDYLSRWRYFVDAPGRMATLRVEVPF